jgi:hypothetical protein
MKFGETIGGEILIIFCVKKRIKKVEYKKLLIQKEIGDRFPISFEKFLKERRI